MTNDIQPIDRNRAKVLRIKASKYIVIDEELFKKSITGSLQRCLEVEQTQYVHEELHKGDCGNHLGRQGLSHKVL